MEERGPWAVAHETPTADLGAEEHVVAGDAAVNGFRGEEELLDNLLAAVVEGFAARMVVQAPGCVSHQMHVGEALRPEEAVTDVLPLSLGFWGFSCTCGTGICAARQTFAPQTRWRRGARS